MRHISGAFLAAALAGATPFASAQVFKCTDADGKTVYSQAPCTKADNKEKVVKLHDAPMTDAPPAGNGSAYGASGNGGNSLGNAAGTDNGNNSARSNQNQGQNRARAMDFPLRQPQKTAGIPPSDQQLVAECEANHGARCNSAAEINYRRQLQRTPGPQEQANIQAAIRARREREENELNRRYFGR